MSWDVVIAVVVGLLVAWLILIGVLLAIKPDDTSVRDAVRLLPDVVRLVSRLARDRTLPRRIRVGLFLLLAYLVIPIDPGLTSSRSLATPMTLSSYCSCSAGSCGWPATRLLSATGRERQRG